jgi:hypothetical protein
MQITTAVKLLETLPDILILQGRAIAFEMDAIFAQRYPQIGWNRLLPSDAVRMQLEDIHEDLELMQKNNSEEFVQQTGEEYLKALLELLSTREKFENYLKWHPDADIRRLTFRFMAFLASACLLLEKALEDSLCDDVKTQLISVVHEWLLLPASTGE